VSEAEKGNYDSIIMGRNVCVGIVVRTHTEGVRGLGRGRGFETTEGRSVFEWDRSLEVEEVVRKLCTRVLEILAILVNHSFITQAKIAERLGLPGSDLPQEVLRFLELDSVAELLYDADEETQKLAEELREKASRECD
jgi:hypothetical protein